MAPSSAVEATASPQNDPESLLDTEDAGTFLAISAKTLQAWRCKGRGPKWIRFSKGCVRYKRRDLIAFIQAGMFG